MPQLSDATLFSLVFVALLLSSTLLQQWLLTRHIRHVMRARNQVPEAFATHVSLQAHQRAADYTVAKHRLELLEVAFAAALTLGWTLLGGLDALAYGMDAWLGSAGQSTPLSQWALLMGFGLIGGLLTLPFDAWRVFRIEQRFGFNQSSLRLFVTDQVKGAVVAFVLLGGLVAALLTLMRSAGPNWWLWAFVLWSAFSLTLMVLYPLVILPWFNTFSPLGDDEKSREVKARAQTLMQRCAFAARDVLQMDASKRSSHANAYFTGLGRARRVVLFDTLLAQLEPAEIEAVLAHELGHFKLGHIRKRLINALALALLGFALLGWLAQQGWFYAGMGVSSAVLGAHHEAQALMLFALLAPLVGSFATPLASWSSRQHEFEADAFAAQHASAVHLSQALVKLHRDNAGTLTPDPWYVRFHYSHPPLIQRLEALRSHAG